MKPLCIDLYSGLGGWAEGFLAEGYRVVGFDVERHRYRKAAVKCGGDWFGSGSDCSLMRQMSSKSSARKAASAQIAKIPFNLSRYIARCYKPEVRESVYV